MFFSAQRADPPRAVGADRLLVMVTSSEKSSSASRRLRTVANVDENIKAARKKALDHQNMIEKLAEPLYAVSEKLSVLDHAQASVSTASERKIKSLTDGLEKKIEKLKEDTAAKIEQIKIDTKAKIESLQSEQHSAENDLSIEYAEAIVQFSLGGSPADLSTVLGVSVREAKNLIETSKADLEKAGISVTSPLISPTTAAPDEDRVVATKAADDTMQQSA